MLMKHTRLGQGGAVSKCCVNTLELMDLEKDVAECIKITCEKCGRTLTLIAGVWYPKSPTNG